MNTGGSSKSFRPKSFGATRPCPPLSIQKHTRKWVRRGTEKPRIGQREVMLKEQAPFLFWSVLITLFNSKSTKQITMAFEIGRRGNWRMFWATEAALLLGHAFLSLTWKSTVHLFLGLPYFLSKTIVSSSYNASYINPAMQHGKNWMCSWTWV